MVALLLRIDALKVDFCDFWFIPQQLDMWTDLRDAIVSAVTQRELHPCSLKNLLHVQNATGRPIWLYTSPHSGGPQTKVPATGVTAPWHDSHPYAPPLSWPRETKRGLANSMMVQFVNLFDYWVRTRLLAVALRLHFVYSLTLTHSLALLGASLSLSVAC